MGAPFDKRPGLLAALEAIAADGVGVLLVAKRDRLARDVVVSAMVERLAERAGARVLAADGTGNGPEAQLMRAMVDLFAQYERALIRAHTKAALGVKRARGERAGEVPYGYRLATGGHRLELAAREQGVIAEVRSLRSQGLTIRAIVERLSAIGAPARGSRWYATTVARILRRTQAAV